MCRISPTETFTLIVALCMSSAASGASNHHFPHRPYQNKRRLTLLPVFSLLYVFLSKSAVSTVAEKACRPDQCPAGVLAGDRVLIKAFADNIPPLLCFLSVSRFVDSVSGSHSLFLCLPVSLSLAVVQLIMVLVCSSRAWHPN